MTRFDYLHAPTASQFIALRKALSDARTYPALLALITVVLVEGALCGLFAVRLHEAAGDLEAAHLSYSISHAKIAQARLEHAHVLSLIDVDRRVRAIRVSGFARARRIVALANEIPQRAWLTDLTYSAGSIHVSGRSEGALALGSVMRGANRIATGMHPMLIDAQSTSNSKAPSTMTFDILLRGRVKK